MPGSQFPYPRRSSKPPQPPWKSARASYQRKRKIKTYGVPLASVLALLLFVLYYTSRPSHHPGVRAAATSSSVVIVTTLDLKLSEQFREAIKANRRQYAAQHGYATFFPNTSDYDLGSWPQSWSLVPALRHAMTLHPDHAWMWYLSSSALITNTSQSLDRKLLAPRTLETLAIANQAVVPDSAIKTYPHLKGERVDLVLTHDGHGLSVDSFFVRTGDWAKYFLDMWFDPLYRSYNFAAAEKHVLEHIVQWHMAVFSRLVLVPQRLVNSYWHGNARSEGSKDAGK
jgi:hypothetical protein